MKKLLLSAMLFTSVLTALCQTSFEKTYDYWDLSEGNVAYEHNDGFTMVGGAVSGNRNYLIILRTNLYGDTLSVVKYDFGESKYGVLWVRDAVTDHNGNKYFALSNVRDSANFVKFDSQWNLVWKKRLDSNYSIHKMIITSDGNIVAAGHAPYFAYLCKFNTDGILQWKSANIDYDVMILTYRSIFELPDNTIIATFNWTMSTFHENLPSIIRTYSATGDSLALITLNTANSANTILRSILMGDEFISLTQTPGNFVTSFLIRHKADGTIISERQLSSTKSLHNLVHSDGKIIAIGSNSLFDYDSSTLNCFTLDGDSLWSSEIGSFGDKYFYSIKQCTDKGFLLTGVLEKNVLSIIPYMIKTDSLGKISSVGVEEKSEHMTQVYPNPANDLIVIDTPGFENGDLFIYDVMGRLSGNLTISSNRTMVNTTDFHEGVFVYKIISNKRLIQGKFIIKR